MSCFLFLGRGCFTSKLPRSCKLPGITPHRLASLPSRHNLNLEGRIALITGGTCGIGLAIAKRLAENGAKVVVSSRRQKNVDEAVDKLRNDGLQVSGIACNVGKEDDRNQLISEVMALHNDINIFVQNAGVNPHMFDILSTPESALDKTYDVHVKANFRMVQKIFPHMKNSKKPCSIILTSTVGSYVPTLMPGAYAITKASVNAMTRAFAPDLNKHNIRINNIILGAFNTDFVKEVAKNEDILRRFDQLMIMERFGKPVEVAGMAAYLASDDSSYVTGESFGVSGGFTTRP